MIKKNLSELLVPGEVCPEQNWELWGFHHGECLSYIAANRESKEAIVVDPLRDDLAVYRDHLKSLKGIQCIFVVDTHTHADHISGAFELANSVSAPLFTHHQSPTKRTHFRVVGRALLPSKSGKVEFISTPGHTGDGMCVWWGPFVFTGDTVLFGDVGRDDLPGGDPASHYESVQELKNILPVSVLMCPGHDHKGGRVSSWGKQLELNASLTQGREDFIRECAAFDAAAPALLKKALAENLR